MINYNNTQLEASIAGLFYTDKDWIHPTTSIETYEIILVLNGTVYIEEDGKKYTLERNNLLLLEPGKIHGGFAVSTGLTSFYWVHFYTSDISKLPCVNKFIKDFNEIHVFKEYLHLHDSSNHLTEFMDISVLNLLARISQHKRFNIGTSSSKLAHEVYEYIKMNADPNLSMANVANHFGYTHEHLSRLINKSFGMGMKKINDDCLITSINNMLANTNYSTKEIADMMNFEDTNIFLKFYKYHTGITPSQYRNIYCFIHMNNR